MVLVAVFMRYENTSLKNNRPLYVARALVVSMCAVTCARSHISAIEQHLCDPLLLLNNAECFLN